jgi:hypothetical protein
MAQEGLNQGLKKQQLDLLTGSLKVSIETLQVLQKMKPHSRKRVAWLEDAINFEKRQIVWASDFISNAR